MKPSRRTIEHARNFVADCWESCGEYSFAQEVRAGCWDHRGDVQAVLKGSENSLIAWFKSRDELNFSETHMHYLHKANP